MKILLFIPMYNCEKQIPRVLDQLTEKVISNLSEVIIINNRSTDQGEQVVQQYLASHYPDERMQKIYPTIPCRFRSVYCAMIIIMVLVVPTKWLLIMP